MFLFPFKDIKENSKVVIYAYGVVGKIYVEQILKTGYCEIAAVVDKKYADNINTDIVMIGIDRLKEVTFDKIIIALKKDGERKAVKKQLISMGIENDKIYSEDPIGYSSVCHYKLDENLESLSDIVYDISTNWDMDIRYCEPVISDIKRYNESIDMMARFKRYIREEKNPERNVIIFRLLYEAGVFDKELMQLYMENILGLTDINNMYHHFLGSTNDIFYYPEYLYSDFYIDRRKIVDKLCKGYKLKVNRKNQRKDKLRVAFIFGMLLNPDIGREAVIVEYANQLCSADCEVGIFLDNAIARVFGNKDAAGFNSRSYEKAHKNAFDSRVEIHYNDELTIKQKLQYPLDLISEYNPDVIIDFTDESSVLTGVLYGKYPIMCVGIRGSSSSTYSDSFFTRCKETAILQDKEYRSVDEHKFIGEWLDIPPIPENIELMNRKENNLSEDDFVLVTVGMRLDVDIDNNFIDHMYVLMEKYDKIKWITVSYNSSEYLLEKCDEAIKRGQMIPWGYEKNLAGFYNLCDLYVNPNRKGGGISIRHAMEMGVPVLMNKFISDGLMSIGVENAVGDNYDELFDYIEKLYNNRELYEERKRMTKEFIDKNHEKTTSQKIISALEKTIDLFEKSGF